MHCARRAASRAGCTAGKSKAIKTAMIATTTRSSIRVNPRRRAMRMIASGGRRGERERSRSLAFVDDESQPGTGDGFKLGGPLGFRGSHADLQGVPLEIVNP